jgi:hypothetical protein
MLAVSGFSFALSFRFVMSDADDYPRCETCDAWGNDAYTFDLPAGPYTVADCEKGVSDPDQHQPHTAEDFGCILHSALQDND